MLGVVHGRPVLNRRITRPTAAIAERLPADARVLDVGCGSGELTPGRGGRALHRRLPPRRGWR